MMDTNRLSVSLRAWSLAMLMVAGAITAAPDAWAQRYLLRIEPGSSVTDHSGHAAATNVTVAFDPRQTAVLRIDTGGNVMIDDFDLLITTDKFDNANGSVGGRQTFVVYMGGALQLDSGTGALTGDGTYFVNAQSSGGSGSLVGTIVSPSSLNDANSPAIDLSNGLGFCTGSMMLRLVGDLSGPRFVVDLRATVLKEDLDDDGVFENRCIDSLIARPGQRDPMPAIELMEFPIVYDPPKLNRPPFPALDPEQEDAHLDKPVQWVEMQDLYAAHGLPMSADAADAIRLHGASDVQVLLLDDEGRVVSGDLSERDSKCLRLSVMEGRRYALAFYAGAGSSPNVRYVLDVEIEPFGWPSACE